MKKVKLLLKNIKKIKILVIGDIALDHYICGEAVKISPEAPVPVIHVNNDRYTAGMAANVVLNAISLGSKAELCGFTGQDNAGDCLINIIKSKGGIYDPYFRSSNISTLVKSRIIVGNQQICRFDREPSPKLYTIKDSKSLSLIEKKMDKIDAIIFSDYAKGTIEQKSADRLIHFARSKGLLIANDPKPNNNICLKNLDLMTPNWEEAVKLAGFQNNRYNNIFIKDVCKIIWKRFKPKYLVITLGSKGMLLSYKGKIIKRIPTFANQVFDVSGAGDSVIASLTLALVAGVNIYEAICFANTVAGIVVSQAGTATANPTQILNY